MIWLLPLITGCKRVVLSQLQESQPFQMHRNSLAKFRLGMELLHREMQRAKSLHMAHMREACGHQQVDAVHVKHQRIHTRLQQTHSHLVCGGRGLQ